MAFPEGAKVNYLYTLQVPHGYVRISYETELNSPPRYNEKLDVFSFANVVISTLTYEWPNPGPPTRYHGDQLIGLNELQRREHYVVKFAAQENQLFLTIVHQCLENRPDKRPSSVMLVQELKHIESTLSSGSHVAAPIEHLRQQLSAKEEECRQKAEVIREKDRVIREKDEALKENEEAVREKSATIQALQAEIQQLRDQLAVPQKVS